MLILVTGGSGSGKSAYAENLVCGLSGTRVYLATMETKSDEAKARIAKHRAAREGRGFVTVERTKNIGNVTLPPHANVLLEDMGNLVANELFSKREPDGIRNGGDIADAGHEKEANSQRTIDKTNNVEREDDKAQRKDNGEQREDNEAQRKDQDVIRIMEDMERFICTCDHLTVVTNEIFSGGTDYDTEMLHYMKTLADINRRLATHADVVVEVICGLPSVLKGADIGIV